jgi:hypothetical protein
MVISKQSNFSYIVVKVISSISMITQAQFHEYCGSNAALAATSFVGTCAIDGMIDTMAAKSFVMELSPLRRSLKTKSMTSSSIHGVKDV